MKYLGPCNCKPGLYRDNCPQCEGTGRRIDFAAHCAEVRARMAQRNVDRPARGIMNAGERQEDAK